jgi:hypothetical protein
MCSCLSSCQYRVFDFFRNAITRTLVVETINLGWRKRVRLFTLLITGLWIRIDSIWIRNQHFCSIRIQANTELCRQFFSPIFWKSNFESNQIKNTVLFIKIFLPCPWTRIRIPNTDKDPQSHWIRIQSGSTTLINNVLLLQSLAFEL